MSVDAFAASSLSNTSSNASSGKRTASVPRSVSLTSQSNRGSVVPQSRDSSRPPSRAVSHISQSTQSRAGSQIGEDDVISLADDSDAVSCLPLNVALALSSLISMMSCSRMPSSRSLRTTAGRPSSCTRSSSIWAHKRPRGSSPRSASCRRSSTLCSPRMSTRARSSNTRLRRDRSSTNGFVFVLHLASDTHNSSDSLAHCLLEEWFRNLCDRRDGHPL